MGWRKDLEIAVGVRALGLLQFLYEKTDGRIGPRYGRWQFLLLRCKGRKTGKIRTVELLYIEDGDNVCVIGSKGGSDSPPAWLVNIQANPDAEVQVGRQRWPVAARVANSAERARLWRKANEVWDYDAYQRRSSREIPVVILERVKSRQPRTEGAVRHNGA
jgi:deazaflavin-dependent oxidoreductase (nitroreductase family)